MKKSMMDILACPVCKGTLELRINDADGDDVVSGVLHCVECDETYPIQDSIPNLLPADLRIG